VNIEQVTKVLIEILKEDQKTFGHNDGDSITDGTLPHGGLKGFQSDVTPTIVLRLAKRLGQALGDDVDPVNIFVSSDKRKKLTVRQAAERFLDKYGATGGKQ
jgi:hypothetical protein